MASQDTVTVEQLKASFEKLDTEKKGKLTEDQFREFASQYPKQISQSDVIRILRHMTDKTEEQNVTLDSFLLWWDNKQKNLLPVLYFKLQIEKQLNKAKEQIEKQKQNIPENAQASNFAVSVNNGSNQQQTVFSFRVSTHTQSELDSQELRDLLKLGSKPAAVFKIKVSKDIDEAKTTLEDLVEQGKQILECVLPVELSEQYLKLVDIQVEKHGEYLLLSISSSNDLIQSMTQSYQSIVNEFKFQDQSVVFNASYSSEFDMGKSITSSNSILADLLRGLKVNISLSSSSIVLDNLRQLLFSKIEAELKQPNGTYAELKSRKKNSDYGLFVISALINGISIKLNTEKFEDMLPPQSTALTYESLISKIKTQSSKADEALSLPIFQDLLNFFNDYTYSDFDLYAFGPGLFTNVHLKTNELSALLNKIFQS